MKRSALFATLVVGAICAIPVQAQAPPTALDHYALTNVRIVAAPGRVIERGTVVVRNGRITAVGAQAEVPAAAVRVDLPGHTVYAGLVDAATTLGVADVSGQNAAQGSELMPARSAADVWAPTAADLEAVRNAGFTTLGLTFNGGIFPGRVAAVHTGSASRSAVLRTPVAQQVLFGRRRGGYPGTLMGAIAYVKQSFFDVQYDVRARQAWERNPSGPRPQYDPEHRALQPAATGEIPVWFVASGERDLNRLNAIAAEMGVRSYTIVGAQEGFRAIDALKKSGQPVIVTLDFPSANELTGRAFEMNITPVSGRNTAREEADSIALRSARGNAAALVRAGVPFAFASYGLPNSTLVRDRVRATIEAGLSADEALRALTVTPARVLGLENAIGTIDTGKLANLVVTQGDLFAADSRVKHVFVEGVRYDVPAAPDARRGPAAGAPRGGGADLTTGAWVTQIEAMGTTIELTLTFSGSGEALSGRLESQMGNSTLRGRQNGNEFTVSGTAQSAGLPPLPLTITGRINGDEIQGVINAEGRPAINFTARRRVAGSASTKEVSQ